MPKKKDSTEELKKQLKDLQDKIVSLEENKKTQVDDQDQTKSEIFRVETLYSWSSPERLYIPRNRKWFIYLFILILIIILVLLFMEQFIIIAPVAAIGFVAYILATVPPRDIEHKLTTEGLNSDGHSYLWQEMWDFWVTKKGDEKFLHIDTYLNYPRRITILTGKADLELIKQIIAQYIPFREIPKENFLDKAFNFLSEKFHKLAS